uniref:Uncharacterized protein n=2 Tax=unclassified Arthrobacter TaxID=235627 RepID=I3W185_9MICC|nr:hypothetical protein [Arthrobacter sp. J3.40]AFK89614.1 hypothetical protein [Arthrobacter sp. J3.53]
MAASWPLGTGAVALDIFKADPQVQGRIITVAPVHRQLTGASPNVEWVLSVLARHQCGSGPGGTSFAMVSFLPRIDGLKYANPVRI